MFKLFQPLNKSFFLRDKKRKDKFKLINFKFQ